MINKILWTSVTTGSIFIWAYHTYTNLQVLQISAGIKMRGLNKFDKEEEIIWRVFYFPDRSNKIQELILKNRNNLDIFTLIKNEPWLFHDDQFKSIKDDYNHMTEWLDKINLNPVNLENEITNLIGGYIKDLNKKIMDRGEENLLDYEKRILSEQNHMMELKNELNIFINKINPKLDEVSYISQEKLTSTEALLNKVFDEVDLISHYSHEMLYEDFHTQASLLQSTTAYTNNLILEIGKEEFNNLVSFATSFMEVFNHINNNVLPWEEHPIKIYIAIVALFLAIAITGCYKVLILWDNMVSRGQGSWPKMMARLRRDRKLLILMPFQLVVKYLGSLAIITFGLIYSGFMPEPLYSWFMLLKNRSISFFISSRIQEWGLYLANVGEWIPDLFLFSYFGFAFGGVALLIYIFKQRRILKANKGKDIDYESKKESEDDEEEILLSMESITESSTPQKKRDRKSVV